MRTTIPFSRHLFLIGIVAGILCCANWSHGVSVSISPASVSNNYAGTVSLQITGLLTGETVRVEKYMDANTNGVIDAMDPLVQSFQITDGQAAIIGGVTNINVPSDLTTTDGAITASLNFANIGIEQRLVGQYLYRVSSPSGRFVSVTNTFTVINTPYPQSLNGVVQCGGTNIPYAGVLIFPPSFLSGGGGSPIAGILADGTGSYSINLPPGSYLAWAFQNNYVCNVGAAPVVTLSADIPVSTNLSLIPATQTISGRIVDSVNTNKGLGGILVVPEAKDGLVAIGFSSTNGTFSVPATPDQWKIGLDSDELSLWGYVNPQNHVTVNTSSGSVSGVTLALPKATALFYGHVTDAAGNPLAGVDLYLNDNMNNLYQTDAYTDTNGYYVADVVGGLINDPWWIQMETTFTNLVFSTPAFEATGNGTNVSAGTATLVNFTSLAALNTISGTLTDHNGNPLSGVGIGASTTINGQNYQQYVDTGAQGVYAMNVATGSWTVWVNTGGGHDSLPSGYIPPNNQTVVISNTNAAINFIALPAAVPSQVTSPNPANGATNVSIAPTLSWADDGSALSYDVYFNGSFVTNVFGTNYFSGMLAAATTYSWQINAWNSLGCATGATWSFTTTSTYSNFSFAVSNGTISITGYSGPGGAIVVPGVIYGMPVVSIGMFAFANCTNLFSVTLQAGITNIGDDAFIFCSNLAAIYFNGNPPATGANVFYGDPGSLTAYYLTGASGWGGTFDGLPTATWTTSFLFTSSGSAITITGYTGSGGFVTIPGTLNGLPVTGIGAGAFSNASGISGISIPNSVTNIGAAAFYNCFNLTSVSIPGNVAGIGPAAFAESGLTSLALSNGVSAIGSSAFLDDSLTSVSIPGSVTTIGSYAFYGNNLTQTKISNGVANIGDWAFMGNSLTNINIPGSVTNIGIYAFAFNSLNTVTFSNGVSNIGSWAFMGARIANVVIPASVTSLGNAPFAACTSLTNITLAAGNPAYTNVNGVVFNTSQTLLVQYPGGKSGSSYTVPAGVASLSDGALAGCTNLSSLSVAAGNTAYSSANGVLLDATQTILVQYPAGHALPYVIPDSVTSIGWGAVAESDLDSLTIPGTVTHVGDCAFCYSASLTNLLLSPNVANLGLETFFYCSGLTNVIIPLGVTNIGIRAFARCGNLTSISIPPSVVSIGERAFARCGNLLSLELPNSVTSIGSHAFVNCSGLTSILFGNNIASIADHAFASCSNLTSVTLPASLSSLAAHAFAGCPTLTNLFFLGNAPSSVPGILSGDPSLTINYLPSASGFGSVFTNNPHQTWTPPALQMMADSHFGPQGNQFGFTISGNAGMFVLVEACTNVANPVWCQVGSDTLTNGSTVFGDSNYTNYPARFYRIRTR